MAHSRKNRHTRTHTRAIRRRSLELVDEARRVIRRLERIETLQGARAPAADLLAEVRLLLREGEAWLAAEHGEVATADGEGGRGPTAAAEAALARVPRDDRRGGRWCPRQPAEPPYNRAPMPRYGPPDSFETPRFSGPRTFMRLPHVRDLEDVDVAIVGIPTDGAVVYRSGARFGPEGIRSASVMLRNYNPLLAVDVVDKLSLVDYGDVPTVPGSTVDSLERLRRSARGGRARRGDDAVPGRRSHGPARGAEGARVRARSAGAGPVRLPPRPVGRVLRAEALPRERRPPCGGGGPGRHLAVDPGRAARVAESRVGSRAIRPSSGSTPSRYEELAALGPGAFSERVRNRVGAGPCFLSFDIDFVDPAFAPGTGTPEVGGPSSRDALTYVRSLAGSTSGASTASRCRRRSTLPA